MKRSSGKWLPIGIAGFSLAIVGGAVGAGFALSASPTPTAIVQRADDSTPVTDAPTTTTAPDPAPVTTTTPTTVLPGGVSSSGGSQQPTQAPITTTPPTQQIPDTTTTTQAEFPNEPAAVCVRDGGTVTMTEPPGWQWPPDNDGYCLVGGVDIPIS
jgi:hypothetical protein